MIIMMTKINWRNQKLEILCFVVQSFFIQEDHFNWTDGMDEWRSSSSSVRFYDIFFSRIQRISSNYIFVFHEIGLILVVFFSACVSSLCAYTFQKGVQSWSITILFFLCLEIFVLEFYRFLLRVIAMKGKVFDF